MGSNRQNDDVGSRFDLMELVHYDNNQGNQPYRVYHAVG